jgi:AcrR family transcriptional regulator
MSDPVPLVTEPTRRALSVRQAQTVLGLTVAAIEELRAVGYDGLTVRGVAKRAGVAVATAYTYFTSKDHLVTEVFWRRLEALPETPLDRRRSATARVSATLSDLGLLVVDEPELAAACSSAMLASDPDVRLLRDRIGVEMRRRLRLALGDEGDPAVLRAIELTVTGALVQAGMGHLTYRDLPDRLTEAAALLLAGAR